MEVVGEDGSQVRMKPGQTQELGRDEGLNTSDKTVSWHHISLSIPGVAESQQIRLQFEVLGRNPIYVSRDNDVKIFRRFERGEMGDGEMFCMSAKDPVWYTVRKIESGGEGVRRNDLKSDLVGDLEGAFGFKEGIEHLHPDDVDISDVDPVKEFGFIVEGHEFDLYLLEEVLPPYHAAHQTMLLHHAAHRTILLHHEGDKGQQGRSLFCQKLDFSVCMLLYFLYPIELRHL